MTTKLKGIKAIVVGPLVEELFLRLSLWTQGLVIKQNNIWAHLRSHLILHFQLEDTPPKLAVCIHQRDFKVRNFLIRNSLKKTTS